MLDIDFDKVIAGLGRPRRLRARAISPGAFVASTNIYQHHETGEIERRRIFCRTCAARSASSMSDAQFLEGWNAIFAGEMPGIAPLLARAAQRMPLYAFSNTNPAHVEHFSKAYAGVLGHFREIFLSSAIGLRKPDAGGL